MSGATAVDFDLRLAGRAALIERRQVHERELDRPLDLVGVGTGEKYDRIGGVYADDGLAKPVRPRIGEKAEHRLLRLVGIVRRARTHGRPPAWRPRIKGRPDLAHPSRQRRTLASRSVKHCCLVWRGEPLLA